MSVPEDTFTPEPPVTAQASTTDQSQQTDTGAGEDKAAQTQEQQQQTDAPEGEQQDRDEKGRFKGVQPRIDELTRKRHEAEREAAYWKGVATQGKAPQPSADQPAANPKPTPDQFDDYGDYIEALTEWKAEEKISKALTEREAKAAQQQQAQTRATTWEQRQAQARAAMPDYDAVLGASDAPVAAHVAEAIQDSEHGPALAYHLAKNPDLLDRLNGLSPRAADRELGRLEERLSSKPAEPGTQPAAEPAPAKTTQAPKPAAVTSSQGRTIAQDPSKMTMAEYEAFRSKGPNKARWAR